MKGIKKVVALFAVLVFAFSIFGCSADSTSGENSVENPKPKDDEKSKDNEQTDAQKEATGTYTIGKTTYTVEEGKVRVKAEDGTTKEVGTVSKDGVITITEEGKTTTITATKSEDGETTTTTVQVTTNTAEGTEETKTYEGDLSTGTLVNKEDPEDSLTVSKTEKSDEEEPEKPGEGEEPQNPETPTVKNFTVTFVTNCDTEIAAQTVKEGEKATLPTETLSKTGYEFGGWNLGENPFSFETAIAGEITLTAKWTAISYEITYMGVDGAKNENPAAYTIEDTIILANASKDGFKFEGWFDAEEDGNAVTEIAKGSTGKKIFYARWSVIPPNEYSVKFDSNGGSAVSEQTVTEGEKAKKPSDPAKNGYEFAGWYLVTGESVADDAFDFDTAITGAITLKAKWNIVTYKIIYGNVLNATNPNTVITYTVEDEIVLENASKTGFTFDGWFDSEVGGNKIEKIEKGSIGEKNLYAQWTIETYGITYVGADDATNPNPATYTVEQEVILQNASKDKFTFDGWFDALTGGNKVEKIEKGSTGAKTFYARWTVIPPNKYSVKFDTDGGSAVNEQTVTEGEKAKKPSDPAKTGYEFKGWNFDGSTFDFDTAITGAVTLKAQWSLVEYNITYAGADGATNPNVTTKYTIESEDIVLSDAEKKGYEFKGWSNGAAVVTKIAKGTTGDITLTATWKALEYSISYAGVDGAANPNATTTKYTIESEDITLLDAEKNGYEFKGWSNGAAVVTKIAKGTTGDITLTATWKALEYSISYAGVDGAANPNATTTKYTIESEDITLLDAEKNGYEFKGWSNGAAVVTKIAKGTTGDITLTATWKALEYSISYEGVDGAANPNEATKYTVEDEITLKAASKDGFTFDGWFDDATGGNAVTKIAKGSSGEKTLYARWTNASGFTVTIEPNARISVEKTVNDENGNVTLTAADGFTNYAWLIDDVDASSLEGAKLSEDGKTLTLTSAGFRAGSVYQIVLTAKKGSTIYGAQITVKKQSGMNS